MFDACLLPGQKNPLKRSGPSKAARAAAAARHAPKEGGDLENQRRILPRLRFVARIYAASSFATDPSKRRKTHVDK
jgi:hypothetical protein